MRTEDRPVQPAARAVQPADRLATSGWDEARRAAHQVAVPLAASAVPLAEALGTVLAEPVRALVPIPSVDCSAMDGYAVCGPPPWAVVASARAGEDIPAPLWSGAACEIATGAPVPAGTLGVLPYEQARRTGELVDGSVEPGRHIRRSGEECAEGEQVLAAGAVLGPAALGLAAALGYDTVPVRPTPTVAALVTGNELLERGLPSGGRVRDAIGPMLPGLTAWAGGRLTGTTSLADSATALAEALRASDAELTMVSGSSSRGPADHLRPVLLSLGAKLVVDGVRCRPGHPQALARMPDGRLVVGLPGNPLAAFVAFLTLALPALAGLRGLPLPALPCADPPVGGRGLAGKPGATQLVPVRVRAGQLTELRFAGSAMLRGLAAADALAVIAPTGQVRLHPLP